MSAGKMRATACVCVCLSAFALAEEKICEILFPSVLS